MESLHLDLLYIKKYILEYKLKYNDNYDIEKIFLEEHPELYDQYTFLIKRLIKSNENSFLDVMLSNIDDIYNGKKTKEEVELKMGQILKEKYIDPLLK